MQKFFIEVTDTFAGEANYSWVKRYIVNANTMRGAVNKFSRYIKCPWGCVTDCGDMKRYDSKIDAACFFISWYDEQSDTYLNIVEI
jgi:hypothetical protein